MIPLPAQVRHDLQQSLPGSPAVKIITRDSVYRRVPAWQAENYEILAFFTSMGTTLTELEFALQHRPGVWITTMITPPGIHNPDWPITYRDLTEFRPQVRALMRLADLL